MVISIGAILNRILGLPVFVDNYIWLIHSNDKQKACVVDPGESASVLAYLEKHQLQLEKIIVTHRHHDHVNGIKALCEKYPECTVYGPADEDIPHRMVACKEGDEITFDDMQFIVLDVRGHTEGHIAYYSKQQKIIFSGDTLFAMGCGRLSGGTAEQHYNALKKISQLPEDTMVYCTHEYTEANLAFAKVVDNNEAIIAREKKELARRAINEATVPMLLKQELLLNPFLRCHEKNIQQAVELYCQKPLSNPAQVFTELRRWKDHF